MEQATTGSISSNLIPQGQVNESATWAPHCALYASLVVDWRREAGLQPDATTDVLQKAPRCPPVCRQLWRLTVDYRSNCRAAAFA